MRPSLLFALLAVCLAAASAEDLDHARIAASADELIALGDRSPGTPGALKAVELIEARLRATGLEPVRVRTTVAATVDEGSTLAVDGTTIRLAPHRTSRAATAGTGGAEITGPLLFAGKGALADYRGRTVAGTIVVLDGDSGAAWAQAAQLGAAAVVFRGATAIDRRNLGLQGAHVSVEFPRFVAELDPALDGKPATLRSTVTLQPATGWTVCARIAGTGKHSEAVLLTAGYESPDAVAAVSPGTVRAWNAAVLLETARALAAAPTQRDVIVAFHGGRGEMMRGLRHLVAGLVLSRDSKGGYGQDSIVDTQRTEATLQLWRERAMADGFAAALGEQAPSIPRLFELAVERLGEPPAIRTPSAEEAASPAMQETLAQERAKLLAEQKELLEARIRDFIGMEAGRRADQLLRPLDQLRERFSPRRRKEMKDAERAQGRSEADAEAAVAAVFGPARKQIEADQAVYDRYRTVQKKLTYGKDLDAVDAPIVAEMVKVAAGNFARHLAVIERRRDDFTSLAEARRMLGGAALIHCIGIDLSDGNDRFSSATKGTWQTWEEELGWLHSGLGKLAEDLNRQAGQPRVAFERAAHDSVDEVDAWFGENYIHEGGIAGLYLPSATLSTVNDARLRLGSPADTPAAFAKDRFMAQVGGLRRFLAAYVDAPFLANRRGKGLRAAAPRLEVEVMSIGTKTGRRGFSYPLTFLLRDATSGLVGDVRLEETSWGDAFGVSRVAFVPEGHPGLHSLPLQIYGHDAGGRINAVLADSGRQGVAAGFSFAKDKASDLLPVVFECTGSSLFNVFEPRLMAALEKVSVLSATRDSPPDYAHVETSRDLALAAVFSERHVRLRLTATQGQVGNRLVITGHAALARTGETDPRQLARGLPPGNLTADTALDVAEDMWRLNDQRLALLRRNGINPDSLVTLHSEAESRLAQARQAFAEKDWESARGAAQAAWSLSGRVYPSLLSTANDIVYGLVVMLLFSIPFAWICERLFLAGATIVRKVIGFGAFFVATFLFFYFFHPAFALATTPMIIFLAFVIIIMSTWVIALVYNKFEHEMELIRMSGMGMHKADVSRLGTLFATVQLGISNMRRRPLRTFLTAATVVLMTFILLTFASFNPSVGAQRLSLDAAPPYNGVLVRQNGWLEMSEQVGERVRQRWGDRFHLHPVRWLAPGQKTPKYPLSGPDGRSSDVTGLVGIDFDDPTGLESALVRGALADTDAPRGFGGESDWLFLPTEVLARLGIAPGGTILLRGVPLRAGTIDLARLGQLQQLGGDALTPLAYDMADKNRMDETQRLSQIAGDSAPSGESSTAIHLSPAATGVAHVGVVERLGGRLRALALIPRDRALDVGDAADDIARELATTLRVGEGGETYLLTSVGKISVAGLAAVLIPLILGGMIIFSTMLNSVAERGKEIFIYASLGLAPIHVAALFLVEAGIYAVIGGLGGYMLAQVIIAALGLAASFGWGVQPDLNYSSFTAVVTILMVMATVLLSALYPALVASKAANPGTTDFKVPEPQGDRLEIAFPFTVAARDVRGLCAFLAKYFDMHTEAAAGCFTAAEAGMRADGNAFEVSAKVWLSPFDLGISQRFAMRAVPTDVKAIYSVQLTLDLLSGQRAAWRRTNLAFLKDLRQQFLVWRTLSPETMDLYRAEGGDDEARRRIEAAKAPTVPVTPAAAVGVAS